jgi:hypothetical protein
LAFHAIGNSNCLLYGLAGFHFCGHVSVETILGGAMSDRHMVSI